MGNILDRKGPFRGVKLLYNESGRDIILKTGLKARQFALEGSFGELGKSNEKTDYLIVFLLLIPYTAIAELTVYFLDVGQGDCAIIECDGEVMIIDGGLPGQSSTPLYIRVNEVTKGDQYYKTKRTLESFVGHINE